jgi:hypothetical protein
MKGILFKPWKAKAIHDSPVTQEWQTRRIMKPCSQATVVGRNSNGELDNNVPRVQPDWASTEEKPRYQVGEVVYIKEVWACDKEFDNLKPLGIPAIGRVVNIVYKDIHPPFNISNSGKWRSPLFMPAWAARDFIQIMDVRAERLQKMTAGDAMVEGCPYPPLKLGNYDDNPAQLVIGGFKALDWYQDLWDSINKNYKWADNPWVWVYKFKKVEK